ncbi:MAG TPA: nucleotidyltransferase family protein [Chloroflexota bacterium]
MLSSTSLAALLAGSWRDEPPPVRISPEDLTQAVPLLIGSGAGPLAWWRLRHSALRDTAPAQELRAAYRENAVQNGLREREIEAAVGLVRSVGIEPILFKGWAVACLYPNVNLRPLGDIDIFIPPGMEAVAAAALSAAGAPRDVDLTHDVPGYLGRGSWEEVFARSQLVGLGSSELRVMGPEDHLAYLCVHFLKHGGWRPIWLCDIAVALETRPAGFDWSICLGPDPKRADWIACALGLAHVLLGAEVAATPVADRAARLPRWLVPTILREWQRPRVAEHTVPPLISASLREPAAWPRAMRERWLSPLDATIRVGGAFNELPRLPYQIVGYALQLKWFLQRFLGAIRGR